MVFWLAVAGQICAGGCACRAAPNGRSQVKSAKRRASALWERGWTKRFRTRTDLPQSRIFERSVQTPLSTRRKKPSGMSYGCTFCPFVAGSGLLDAGFQRSAFDPKRTSKAGDKIQPALTFWLAHKPGSGEPWAPWSI